MKDTLKFTLSSQEFISIWNSFCVEHANLYDLTCEEYVHLLSSDIEKIENTIKLKNEKLELINELDLTRKSILSDMAMLLNKNLEKVSDVVNVLKEHKLLAESKQLDSLNTLLLDIIIKTQEQSKKNQLFLNKAILSLKDLKRNFAGKTSYTTYGANGVTKPLG